MKQMLGLCNVYEIRYRWSCAGHESICEVEVQLHSFPTRQSKGCTKQNPRSILQYRQQCTEHMN